MTDPKWELAHEYGQGCRVYVDANSLTVNGDVVRAQVRHYLVPPGTDKRNQRPIQEMLIEKEFDLGRGRARYHSITFTYVGGELAAPLLTEAEWADADKGTLVELNFVRTLISPKKKRWWLL